MDLKTGWDFSKEEDKERARKYQEEEKPLFIVGSPMCRMFSPLQNMSPWTARKQKQLEADIEHLKFMVEIYRKQVEEGRYFIHEDPAGASST